MPEVTTVEATPPKETPLGRQVREDNEKEILEYLKELAADTPIRVSLIRVLPKHWGGRSIEGTLETYDEPISEEDIKEQWGGGKYTLKIKALNANGSYTYAATKTIKLAGDPKLDALITTDASKSTGPTEGVSVVNKALEMSQSFAEKEARRADRAEQNARVNVGPDPALSMVMDELRSVRSESARAQEKVLELASAKPDSSASDILLGKMIDGESIRLQSFRQQVDHEMRMKNEMHKAEIDRMHSRYEEIARRQEDQHKRELDALNRANDNQMTTLKMSYESQIAGYQREIDHLSRQLAVSQTELAEMRAKKDKSFIDSVTELAAAKEALEVFGGGAPEEGAIERIANKFSPLIEGVAMRVAGEGAAGAAPPQPQPEPEPEIPFNKPVQLPDGRIIVKKSDGKIYEIKSKARPVAAPTGGDALIAVPDEDMKTAIGFMESALAGDADPVQFARTAQNLVPSLVSGPVGELLKTQGVDAFLAAVAKLSPGSPLLQQHGKNWTRKVAAAVLGS